MQSRLQEKQQHLDKMIRKLQLVIYQLVIDIKNKTLNMVNLIKYQGYCDAWSNDRITWEQNNSCRAGETAQQLDTHCSQRDSPAFRYPLFSQRTWVWLSTPVWRGSPTSVAPVPGDSILSTDHQRHLHTCGTCTYIQIFMYAHIFRYSCMHTK